jgi:hypothetical protein
MLFPITDVLRDLSTLRLAEGEDRKTRLPMKSASNGLCSICHSDEETSMFRITSATANFVP